MKQVLSSIVVGTILAIGLVSCPDGGTNTDGAAKAGDLQLVAERVGEKAGTAGASVSYAIRVSEGPESIDAFGLDIAYDPSLLTYTSEWERGDLTADFTQVGVNEVEPGRIRLGGFSVGEPVPAGAKGALAVLQFEAVSYTPSRLSVLRPVDDVASFTISSAQ